MVRSWLCGAVTVPQIIYYPLCITDRRSSLLNSKNQRKTSLKIDLPVGLLYGQASRNYGDSHGHLSVDVRGSHGLTACQAFPWAFQGPGSQNKVFPFAESCLLTCTPKAKYMCSCCTGNLWSLFQQAPKLVSPTFRRPVCCIFPKEVKLTSFLGGLLFPGTLSHHIFFWAPNPRSN